MKKLFIILASFLVFTGCTKVNERGVHIGNTVYYNPASGARVVEWTIDGHTYLSVGSGGFTHSASCSKCNSIKDSIFTEINKIYERLDRKD